MYQDTYTRCTDRFACICKQTPSTYTSPHRGLHVLSALAHGHGFTCAGSCACSCSLRHDTPAPTHGDAHSFPHISKHACSSLCMCLLISSRDHACGHPHTMTSSFALTRKLMGSCQLLLSSNYGIYDAGCSKTIGSGGRGGGRRGTLGTPMPFQEPPASQGHETQEWAGFQ